MQNSIYLSLKRTWYFFLTLTHTFWQDPEYWKGKKVIYIAITFLYILKLTVAKEIKGIDTAYLDKVGLHLEKHHSGYPKIKHSQTHKRYKKVDNWCFEHLKKQQKVKLHPQIA
jgi:hypothetical protein